jgi:hypothetical protein
LRQAVPAAEGWYSDNQTYATMIVGVLGPPATGLYKYDTGLSPEVGIGGVGGVAGTAPTATSYCLSATESGFTYHYVGPGGTVQSGACP